MSETEHPSICVCDECQAARPEPYESPFTTDPHAAVKATARRAAARKSAAKRRRRGHDDA